MLMNNRTRLLLRIVAGLGVLVGLVWTAQGFRVLPYPAESFMVGSLIWAYRGMCLAAIGVILLLVSRLK